VRAINKYADERAPWKLAKSEVEEDRKKLATSLATMLEGLRLANELLAPVMPGVHAKIAECMGQKPQLNGLTVSNGVPGWRVFPWAKK